MTTEVSAPPRACHNLLFSSPPAAPAIPLSCSTRNCFARGFMVHPQLRCSTFVALGQPAKHLAADHLADLRWGRLRFHRRAVVQPLMLGALWMPHLATPCQGVSHLAASVGAPSVSADHFWKAMRSESEQGREHCHPAAEVKPARPAACVARHGHLARARGGFGLYL